MEHRVQWTAPSPAWRALSGAADAEVRRGFNRPMLLRFAADTFMDDYTALLTVDPMRLREMVARPETWRGPAGVVAPTAAAPRFARALQRKRIAAANAASSAVATIAPEPPSALQPALKLYQPAHQRYYLVTASLVCQLPGLPDRAIDVTQEERVTFVVRRLLPKTGVARPEPGASADEYAYVAAGDGPEWRSVAPADAVSILPGEEQLPLFRTAYLADDGRTRKVFGGLVPVSRREAYIAAAPRSDDPQTTGGAVSSFTLDPRLALLKKQVTEPWRRVIDRADATEAMLRAATSASTVPGQSERERTRKEAREQIQTVSWYVLLDLAKYLQQHVPRVWAVVSGTAAPLTSADAALAAAINAATYQRNGVSRTMRAALVDVVAREAQLESVTQPYVEHSTAWPPEPFPLAAIRSTEELNGMLLPPPPIERFSGLAPSTFEALVGAALPQVAAAPLPDSPLATRPVLAAGDPGWFVIRCVYERPRCGPLSPPVVSDPTDVFQLAGFFDPDAPARPIRIGLPADVSPAGLRKFDKNTAFMVSDTLCGHVDRMKGLTLGDLVRSVLPWPLHKGLDVPDKGPCTDASGGSLGMMLSVSLPIITICALMLMMIVVNLLDVLFRWVPYFLVSFPVPGFKGKETA
jgi:hypothetical protein